MKPARFTFIVIVFSFKIDMVPSVYPQGGGVPDISLGREVRSGHSNPDSV